MATVNIENLPDPLYKSLQVRAESQPRSVAQEVTHILSEVLARDEALSILTFRALERNSGREWTRRNT